MSHLMNKILVAVAYIILSSSFLNGAVHAGVINFDDLDPGPTGFSFLGNAPSNFNNLDIADSYLGHQWLPSVGDNVIEFSGWGVGDNTHPPSDGLDPAFSGDNFGHNGFGGISHSIAFSTAQDIVGAYFRVWFDDAANPSRNSQSIRLRGYDGDDNLVATSALLNTTQDWQFLAAGFSNISRLEFFVNEGLSSGYFAVDDITLSPSSTAVSEPSVFSILAFGLMGMAWVSRRRYFS